MKKTVCFDFDGVIHSYTSGWCGAANIPDIPMPGIRKEFEKLDEAGYYIAICSSRAQYKEGRDAIWDWLEENGLRDFVDSVTAEKPPALVYVDDRGMKFEGVCPGLADKIMNFKSWLEG